MVIGMKIRFLVAALVATLVAAGASAEVIERIMAVVNGQPIVRSDVTAALRFNLTPPAPAGTDPVAWTVDRLIERTLMLSEVDRYQPPEPAAAEIDRHVAALEQQAGGAAALDSVLAALGLTRDRLRTYIRDDLRIATYLHERFDSAAEPPEADVLTYYREHPSEFTVGGTLQTFEQAQDEARRKVADARRSALISDWVASLRRRADVTVLPLHVTGQP
jgi:hypothetical protein